MCEVTEDLVQFAVTLYNPLAQLVSYWVRLPVRGIDYTVLGPDLNIVQTQVIAISSSTKRIPERRQSKAQNILVFEVKIQPLGFGTYFVQRDESDNVIQQSLSQIIPVELGKDFEIKNDKISISFNGKTGRMQGFSNLESKISASLAQDYYYYMGHPGNNSNSNEQASNNYIFRPLNNTPTSVNYFMPVKSYIVKGPLVQEIHQVFCPWVTQVVRLYKSYNFAEVEWTVGSIPIHDNKGKEVIVSYQSDLKTNKLFYTDANGRQIMERKLNYRPTWTLKNSEPVAGNYYPVNTKIFLKDVNKDVQFTILTDRSQGGTSLKDGQVELMLHRRLLYDDGRGVGEPLNETGIDGHGLIIRGKQYLYIDTKGNSTIFHRQQAIENFLHPTIAFSELKMTPKEWETKFNTDWAAMKTSLPGNLNLLTLQQWSKDTLLLRLEHVFEKDESTFSKPVTISLKNLFIHFNITAVEELVLGANLKLSDLHRLQWKSDGDIANNPYFKKQEGLDVTLLPMEIKTFAVTISNFF